MAHLSRSRWLPVSLLVLAGARPAQELGVLDAGATRWITQEVSGDAAYEHVRFMTRFHRPRGGSDNLWKVAQYYEEQARAIGLDDVRLIRQQDDTRPWNARFADLWLMGARPERLASTLQTAVHLADFSRPADLTAPLVDIGAADELATQDLTGKIVLSYGPLATVMRTAVQERGALGVLWYPSPFSNGSGIDGGGYTRPDQVRWLTLASEDEPADSGKRSPTFAFSLSLRQGLLLREKLAGAKEPLEVHAHVEAGFGSEQGAEPWQVMVEATIHGSEPDLHQDVVFTGHMQEEATSANDDASGCASTLEVARALHALIESGRIPRPRRTLRFWWTTEISSERRYFADHPEAVRGIWVNVNQDMVGADQSLDILRKQSVTRLPAARFHLLNDVMEAVVEYVVAANTFELSQLQNGIPLYPEPMVAHRGTWQRWNAEAIFFHNNTDHMTFAEAPIGIPGITFTNMPDRYIHSSDDDLWNVDATQLGRSAAAAALIGYTMAAAGPRELQRLAAEVVGRGRERCARNLRLALALVAEQPRDARAQAAAAEQLGYAYARERLALDSLRAIGADEAFRAELEAGLARAQAADQATLASATLRAGVHTAPPAASEAETRLAKLVPALVGGPAEFEAQRGALGSVTGLHALMAFEVLNAVDARRTGLEIARFVAAEAREGGRHTYGEVTPESVLAYLEKVAASGLVRLE